MPLTVKLGNAVSLEFDRDGNRLTGNRVATFHIMDEDSTATRVRTLAHPEQGMWRTHALDPAAWVECPDDPELEQALAAHFGCPIGRPDGDWIDD